MFLIFAVGNFKAVLQWSSQQEHVGNEISWKLSVDELQLNKRGELMTPTFILVSQFTVKYLTSVPAGNADIKAQNGTITWPKTETVSVKMRNNLYFTWDDSQCLWGCFRLVARPHTVANKAAADKSQAALY